MASTSKSSSSKSSKQPTKEQIAQEFNDLRNQQKNLAVKISEIEAEKKEYQLVLDNLKDVDKERTCYRMVGGVLVQRKVGEIIPTLQQNMEQMSQVIESLEKQVQQKGKDLVEFKEKHNIKFQNELPAGEQDNSSASGEQKQDDNKSTGVLVNS